MFHRVGEQSFLDRPRPDRSTAHVATHFPVLSKGSTFRPKPLSQGVVPSSRARTGDLFCFSQVHSICLSPRWESGNLPSGNLPASGNCPRQILPCLPPSSKPSFLWIDPSTNIGYDPILSWEGSDFVSIAFQCFALVIPTGTGFPQGT